MRVGFAGLGHMGEPMATNLVRGGIALTVWNRSPAKIAPLIAIGATAAETPADLFRSCEVVLLMVTDRAAIDAVLGRVDGRFEVPVEGRTIVNTGTISPAESRSLGEDLTAAGASYVEAPVSGSRVPAQRAELVAMLAGEADSLDLVEPILALTCQATFRCGDVPAGLTTKLAVNVFLLGVVTSLAEAVSFGEDNGVDRGVLRAVLDAGQMASPISRVKLAKLVEGDLSPQAAIRDVHYNGRLILEQARASGTPVPLVSECTKLFEAAEDLGLGGEDMVAVIKAFRRPRA